MPISGASSYIVVVPIFLNHWDDANAVNGAFTLDKEATGQPADVARDDLNDLYQELVTRRDTLEETLLDLGLASGTLLGDKTWLHAQCISFNQIMRADHGTTIYARNLPVAPQLGEAREKFLKPLRLMANLWAKVNTYRAALTPPKTALTLQEGTTLATFNTRMDTARGNFNVVEERDQQATLERALRDDQQEIIYPVLKVYRLKVEALFPAGSAILETLPALTDDGSGTPQAGTLGGTFSTTTNEATLTGTPSASKTVVRHQIRASLGPEPDAGDETLTAEYALGAPLTLTTGYGLGTPGALAHFRLVAITADGHEKGSDWVTIQRPL